MVLFCREKGKALAITLHIQPKARKTEIIGIHGDALKVKVAAPPIDGAANEEIIAFFARFLGVPKSRIEMTQGERSRHKTIEIDGVTAGELTSLLIKQGVLTIKLG